MSCCVRIALLAAVLAGGCNFRVLGLPLASDGNDLAMTLADVDASMAGAVDLAGVVDLTMPTPPRDLAAPPDLAPTSCASTSCATACTPCCQESCTTGSSCSQSCPGGGCDCRFTCSNVNSCNVSCAGGSSCVALGDNANDATLNCSGGATCWLRCGQNLSNSCTLNCAGNASCRIDCGTNVGSCNLNNCPGTTLSCPNNVKVCGRACP